MSARFIVRIDPERCKGCTLCVTFCPTQTLAMSRGFNRKGSHVAEVARPEACIGCRQCVLICPDVCIEIDRVTGPESAPETPAGGAGK